LYELAPDEKTLYAKGAREVEEMAKALHKKKK
jgi:hypothetical protein